MHQWKLVELRAKTDRDVTRAVRRDIERGLALASVASNHRSPQFARAQEAERRARLLLNVVPEDPLLRAGVADLQAALARVPRTTILRAAV